MNSDAELIRETATPMLIPDLREIPLAQLADRSMDSTDIVAGLVERCLDEVESPSHVLVLAFNSSI